MLILLYSNAKGCVDTRPVVGSRQAAHLVHVWLQPVQRRLGGETGTNFEAIKVMFGGNLQDHAFFDGLDWEHLYDKDGPRPRRSRTPATTASSVPGTTRCLSIGQRTPVFEVPAPPLQLPSHTRL